MPSYKELIPLLKSGKGPREIIEHFDVSSWRIRRMLRGKRLRAELDLESEISALVAAYRIGSRAAEFVSRLQNLLDCDSPETVRKVCLALIEEATRSVEESPVARPQTPLELMLAAEKRRA